MGLWNEDQKHGGGVMVTLDDLYFEGNFSYNKMTVSDVNTERQYARFVLKSIMS